MEARLLTPEIPPGEEELPYSYGSPFDAELHWKQRSLLVDSLQLAWKGRRDVYVAGNMGLYFGTRQIPHNDFLAPDVMVILDTTDRIRKSWVVWQEERSPNLVIELVSPSTEQYDRGKKMEIYARSLHVFEVFLFDPLDGRLEGYLLNRSSGQYVARTPEDDGGFTSPQLGLRLAPHDQPIRTDTRRLLRWFTPEGALLPTGEERAEALAQRLRDLGIDPGP